MGVQPSASCSKPLVLYSGPNFTGRMLALSTRGVWLNLTAFGFNNRASSYRIGGCAATFNSLSNGSGLTYPGATGTGESSGAMVSGWDDTVSSVFIR